MITNHNNILYILYRENRGRQLGETTTRSNDMLTTIERLFYVRTAINPLVSAPVCPCAYLLSIIVVISLVILS